MPNPNVTRIYFYEVAADGERPAYAWRFEEPVERGKHEDRIKEVATAAELPWNPGDLRPSRSGLSPLDIHVANDEVCAFAFYLDATDSEQRQRLAFDNPPFVELPLNAGDGLKGMTEARSYPETGTTSRWASFVCDLKAVRGSGLAKRIRDLPQKDHTGALKIPLWFNFVDPVLKGSPWVITTGDHEHHRDDDNDEHEHRSSARRGPVFTHGGVHPLSLANLVVEL